MPITKYLTELEAARLLGLSPKTLSHWRLRGSGPTARRFGAAVRYALEDVQAFADRSIVRTEETQ